MIKNQVKNIIKMSLWVTLVTLLGEGVLGVSAYWPFLVLLINWSGVFWTALVVGILVSVLNGLSIGLASLLIVLSVGIIMLVLGEGQASLWVQLSLITILLVVVNKILGIHESVGEVMIVLAVSLLTLRSGSLGDTIRIKYRS